MVFEILKFNMFWLNEIVFCVIDIFFSKYDENDGFERCKIIKCIGWMLIYIKYNI